MPEEAARHVYVHVPFCARRCSYCDFSIAVRKVVPVEEYLNALQRELEIRFGGREHGSVDTLYFGGGTPSRLGGAGVVRALELVRRFFPLATEAEVTIEANPEDVSYEAAAQWREAGVNRLSLGAQTFNDEVLEWMHRTHDSSGTESAVENARRAGITNLSLDLIFALPASLNRNLLSDVERLLSLAPAHVSLYGLTVEQHTPLGHWVERGVTHELVEEGYEAEFLRAHELLTSGGLEHYEVSNYGAPGFRSRHNSSYWTGASYVGLGPSAHEYDGQARHWNTRNYSDWVELVSSGQSPTAGSEVLTPDNRIAELVYLGLRTADGLHLDALDDPIVAPWIAAGWLVVDELGIARCTPTGWLRLDALAAALTHHRSR